MKLSNKVMLFYLIITLIIVYVEFNSSILKEYKLPSKSVLTLNKKIFGIYQKESSTVGNLNEIWGVSREIIVVDTNESNLSKASKITEVIKEKKKNVLCIKKSCYRLLGVHYNKKRAFVTLYNKNLKEKVKDYKIKDNLESNIFVKNITLNHVDFKEINSTREWSFETFDVNQTKYLPKEIDK